MDFWGKAESLVKLLRNIAILLSNLICLILPFVALCQMFTGEIGKAVLLVLISVFFMVYNRLL